VIGSDVKRTPAQGVARRKKTASSVWDDAAQKTPHARGGYHTSAQKIAAKKVFLKMKELLL